MSKNTTTQTRTCRCGCNESVAGKANYRPGHDARHISILKGDLDTIAASSIRTREDADRIQIEVFDTFGQLQSVALRAKLGRAVDNDKEGLYNSFGDMGVYVPYSENPSLGRMADRADLQASFEAQYPVATKPGKQPADRKPKAVVVVDRDDADEADETLVKPAVAISTIRGEDVEPMWEETTEGDKAEAFEVKIGRWTYPAKHILGMDVRNTKRDGSGEWIPYTAS